MGRPKGSKNKPKTTETINEPKLLQAGAPKRRGRPPGSKNTKAINLSNKPQKRGAKSSKSIIVSEENTQDVSVFENDVQDTQRGYVNPFIDCQHSFECKFEPINEWLNIIPTSDDDKQRLGSYSSTRYPLKTQHTIYPVVAYINVDINTLRSAGHSDSDIYAGCISYLNRNQSKSKLKKLGNLMPYYFKVLGDNRLSVIFFTNERKSKLFWKEGS
jgi:hypothetical protein